MNSKIKFGSQPAGNQPHVPKRFCHFKPAEEQPVRAPDVVPENPQIAMLKTKFGEYQWEYDDQYINRTFVDMTDIEEHDALINFKKIMGFMASLQFTAIDIERFSIAIEEFSEDGIFPKKAGIFLSAMIAASKDADFIVHTSHLSFPLEYLGFENTKNLKIIGNGGAFLCMRMGGGTVSVHGDTNGVLAKNMSGGTIVVYGTIRRLGTHGIEAFSDIHHMKCGRVLRVTPGGVIAHEKSAKMPMPDLARYDSLKDALENQTGGQTAGQTKPRPGGESQ